MAQLKDKLAEVKILINDGYTSQAKDECDNGISMCDNGLASYHNVKNKLVEKFGADELFEDLDAMVTAYL